MRARILCLLGMAFMALLPVAAADAFSGTLAAREVFLTGEFRATSPAIVTQIGGEDAAFGALPPQIELSGDRIRVDYFYAHYMGVHYVVNSYDRAQSREGTVEHTRATVAFDQWTGRDNELVLRTGSDIGPGQATATGRFDQATPVRSLADDQDWDFGPSEDDAEYWASKLDVRAPRGSLLFDQPTFADRVEAEGTFRLYVFGADFRIKDSKGETAYDTGASIDTQSVAHTASWQNVTVLTVYGGQLRVDPGPQTVHSYLEGARFVGDGLVFLGGATGLLLDQARDAHTLDGRDVTFAGTYDLSLRGATDGGFVTGVSGEFQPLAFLSTSATVAGRASWAWGLLLIGAVLATGVGATAFVARRRRASQAILAPPTPPTVPVPPAPMPPMPTPETPRVQDGDLPLEPPVESLQPAGFTWDDLSNDFGLIHAGEKSGVVIVLVPENRLDEFLQAVVSRGLMANDTGDRVPAGKDKLAVVALEPSPLMMN